MRGDSHGNGQAPPSLGASCLVHSSFDLLWEPSSVACFSQMGLCASLVGPDAAAGAVP